MPAKKPDYSFTEIKNIEGALSEITFMPSTLENIDQALFSFLNEDLDLYTTTNKGRIKVPIVWVSSERAFQIKNNQDLRDVNGSLKLPILTIERTSAVKDPSFRGTWQAHTPDTGRNFHRTRRINVPAARTINHGKTSKFQNAFSARKTGVNNNVGHGQLNFPTSKADKSRVVYNTIYKPIPIWVKVMYSIKMRTAYLQQMNDLIQPFFTKTGQMNTFFITHEGHRYEGFIEGDFGQSNNVADLGEDERTYVTDIQLRILGYLMGEGSNDARPKITSVENYVDVKIPRERVIVGDINDNFDELDEGKGFYRE